VHGPPPTERVGGNHRRPIKDAAGGRRASDHGAVANNSLPDLVNSLPAPKISLHRPGTFPALKAQGILPQAFEVTGPIPRESSPQRATRKNFAAKFAANGNWASHTGPGIASAPHSSCFCPRNLPRFTAPPRSARRQRDEDNQRVFATHGIDMENDAALAREKARLGREFWPKLRRFAARLPFAEDLVTAYFCAFDRDTPRRVQVALIGALA
jgi:hypothetical protein